MPVRPRFDPKRALIAARDFTFLGRAYALGDPFPHAGDAEAASDRLRGRQYEARAVNYAPEAEPADEPVQMTKAEKNGYYQIDAPWLERPLTIRGKVNAEKALTEMREEGPPLGWIDGGSDVEVEEAGGGWYAISAPWLEAPEKVQGREAAEARQREIHDAGEPEAHHGVALTESEGGNGYYEVKADWQAEAEKVHGIDAARERAAELRAEGPPEGWTPEAGPVAAETADNQTDPADPASEGADENEAKAESTEGAAQAAAADEGSDTADEGDGADTAAGGDQADAPAEGEAGKSEDPPADA